jgi:hypothetical protein
MLSPAAAQERAHTKGAASAKAKTKVGQASPRPSKAKRGAKTKVARAGKPAAAEPKAQPADKPKPEAQLPAPPLAAAVEEDSSVRSEGGTDVKTVEFTGLDIEGQLKTPQMLFFMNRLRAEFDRPRLPHRSFMPELARSREDKEL